MLCYNIKLPNAIKWVHAILQNGTEPVQNIPQDDKMWNIWFHNYNRRSGRFMGKRLGVFSPLSPLAKYPLP